MKRPGGHVEGGSLPLLFEMIIPVTFSFPRRVYSRKLKEYTKTEIQERDINHGKSKETGTGRGSRCQRRSRLWIRIQMPELLDQSHLGP